MNSPQGSITIAEDKKDDITILRMGGRLDAVSCHLVEEKVKAATTSGVQKMVFDLSALSYLSSAGLRVLLETTKALRKCSGKLVIYALAPGVLGVLKMSGFESLVVVANDEADAFRKVRNIL